MASQIYVSMDDFLETLGNMVVPKNPPELQIVYRGVIIDRMGALPTRMTQYHGSYYSAQKAAEKLCRKYFTGDRAIIDIKTEYKQI